MKYRLKNPLYRANVDLRSCKNHITQAAKRRLPDAKVIVRKSYYSIFAPGFHDGDARAIGRYISMMSPELHSLVKSYYNKIGVKYYGSLFERFD